MNPFNYGTIVKEPYFFDREKEKDYIVSTLKGKNNIVLYAPRRFGKTSLAMKCIKELEKSGIECVYLDFMTIFSRESFINVYTKRLFNKKSNYKKSITLFSKLLSSIKPSLTINSEGSPELSLKYSERSISNQTLDSVLDLPEKLANEKKHYIIVMDEFQEIRNLNGENFEKLLRSKIQHHQNVNYLFLGSKTHILQDMFNNKNQAFYNSAATFTIGYLPEKQTIEFLINGFNKSEIEISVEDAKAIICNAEKIPYYIQLLASEIWQSTVNTKKKVDKDIISAATSKMVERKNDYYIELFNKQTAYQKKLLKALVFDNKGLLSKDFAYKYRLSATSTTQKALAGLLDKGILEKENNEYSFCDPFFKMFLLRFVA